jgi:hypothetical protein
MDTVVGEVQATEAAQGDDDDEEDETKFVAKRIVKTNYVKKGGVRVMKVCVVRAGGRILCKWAYMDHLEDVGANVAQPDLQEMLDECLIVCLDIKITFK